MIVPLVLGGVALVYLATRPKQNQATTFTGVSGTPYAIAKNARSTAQIQIMDVFLLPNGTPIMEFSVTGGVNGAKQFLSSPMQANDPILKRARQDLAV